MPKMLFKNGEQVCYLLIQTGANTLTHQTQVLVKTGLALNQPRCQIFAFHIRTTIGKSSGNAVTEGMAILFITPASMHP